MGLPQSKPTKKRPSLLRAALSNPHVLDRALPGLDQISQAMAILVKQYYPESALGIIELGASDGRLTEFLLAIGIDPAQLLLLEGDKAWSQQLKQRFPHIRSAHCDALQLKKQLNHYDKKTSLIVSNLSLGNLSFRKERALMQQIDEVLSEDGIFIQLTYRAYGDVFLKRSQQFTRIDFSYVWKHLPPARIDVFRHRSLDQY